MKLTVGFIVAVLAFCPLTQAQKGSFEYFESRADEYLNKRITVFIIMAESPEGEEDFRVFKIYTSDAKADHTSYGWAKVPLKNATVFAKRHPLQEPPWRARNASGIFRRVEDGDPVQKILRKGAYYLDTSQER